MSDRLADGLSEADVALDPFVQFDRWFRDVLASGGPEPTAMTVATATRDGRPSARMVLLKGVDERGFVFYTNYESRKGGELAENPRAALLFHWPQLQRQVRVTGTVARVAPEESDAYFRSRARGSRLGAWASHQSRVIPDRAALEADLARVEAAYPGEDIPRPPYWGGFRVVPETFEFWQSRPSRLHDRLRYTRQPDGRWLIDRLSP
ncbi:MAG TPA: pyridoxamine 5'-phosphate oxidase [Thermomicrobiales bacterium]|nr:pyridoxamine 5'-phosphate oxidase [Thermomicrobiales bacterium]